MENDNKVTGIVLAGGKSSRMGKDKGCCLLKGKPMVNYALETLVTIADKIIIGANSDDYNQLGYPVFADEIKNIGPIGGIYTCLKSSQTSDNIILSCDMPMVTSDLLKYILSEKDSYEIVIPLFNELPEPLCAYYNKRIADRLSGLIKEGQFKIQEVVKSFNVKFLPIDAKLSFYSESLFTNINSQKDLNNIEKKNNSEKHHS